RPGRGAGARAFARVPPRSGVGLHALGRDRVAHGGRARAPPPHEARRRRHAHPHREERGLPVRPRSAMTFRRLVLALRGRIALKLTLTLVGFVAISLVAAGLYLSRALERVAIEVLEARLTMAGRVLHDEALGPVHVCAAPTAGEAFVQRAAHPTRTP